MHVIPYRFTLYTQNERVIQFENNQKVFLQAMLLQVCLSHYIILLRSGGILVNRIFKKLLLFNLWFSEKHYRYKGTYIAKTG